MFKKLFLISLGLQAIVSFQALHSQSNSNNGNGAGLQDLAEFEIVQQVADPTSVMPTAPMSSPTGFSRSILETPRSVSSLSSEMIDLIGIRDGDQLSRIIPGTYTVNRWGIAGATQVRGLPADTYIRGMKRIDPQGNIKNVMTMWDNVEIVRGPPSPIFGNGRIGGYVNYVPKSARSGSGTFLSEETGRVQLIYGSYNRAEVQFDVAGPLTLFGRNAGYSVFAQTNDSDSYYDLNFQRDRILQASFSMDWNDNIRIESGFIYQRAITAGQAGANRVTQSTFDQGLYMTGRALVDLDTDRDGRVSEAELQASRNFTDHRGPRPLTLTFRVPLGIPASERVVPGVPVALQQLLMLPEYANVAATPAGQAILAAPAGGPLDNGGRVVPVGMFLNPAEIGFVERDWSLVAIEEKADGNTFTYYFDVINEPQGSDWSFKHQFFIDYQYQDKESQLPFNQIQEIFVLENKFTTTYAPSRLPDWLGLEMLASVNWRFTDMDRVATSGDYDSRRDLVFGYSPTDTFTSFLRTGDRSFETGEPPSLVMKSDYNELGAGFLFDATFVDFVSVLGGIRYDYVDATTSEGERFARFALAGATGGTLPAREASGTDTAVSKSISVSFNLPYNIRPYVTAAESSALLSGTALEIAFPNVNSGNILGAATLIEAGVKGSLLDGRMTYGLTAFDQQRSSSVQEEGESYVRSTVNRGWEAELRFLINNNWSLALSGTWMRIKRTQLAPGTSRTALATASYIGFEDVVDAAGNVLFPADAFLFGGNPLVQIPAELTEFHIFGQYPNRVLGLFLSYRSDHGWGATLNTSAVKDVSASSDIPDLLRLPSSLSHNVSAYYETPNKLWRFSALVRNITDEEFFSPNNGSFGGTLLQRAFPRNYELNVTRRF